MYLVYFDDPSWARAAVRELQDIDIEGQNLRLFQYPKQLRSDPNVGPTGPRGQNGGTDVDDAIDDGDEDDDEDDDDNGEVELSSL